MNMMYEAFTARIGWAAGDLVLTIGLVLVVGAVMVIRCAVESYRAAKCRKRG